MNSETRSAKDIVHILLDNLCDHYEKHHINRTNIMNNYIAKTKSGNIYPLEENCDRKIDDLLNGRTSQFTTVFQNEKCCVKLHDKIMDNGMPLIIMKVNNIIMAIKRRSDTHVLLFKYQPKIFGMKCDSTVAKSYADQLESNCFECYLNDKKFEKILATWLGRKQSDSPQSTLYVDTNSLKNMLQKISTDSRCFFLISGNDPYFAYFQVNNNENKITYILPLGCFV